ncbi:inositol monophosphatase family protein [Reinekea marina]|uniref:Inositol monophosphatase family protein n=1 Tax=Reinekea marina TaxID=1310421 RepID=A0ABV7WUP6_9GAMM|nr:inositol monophosphatase family protein [Reinekea marina]MDN3649093.1 inositol monophosphatase family protein [Reinekea marina]
MQPIVSIALRAAQSAADKINYTIENIDKLMDEGDSREDVLKKAFEDAAWRARKAIRNAHTKHHIDSPQIGMEESREWDGQSKWVVDVASGINNIKAGYPGFLVNVSLYTKDKIDVAAIVDPMSEDFMTAQRGRGVQANERRVRAVYAPIANATASLQTADIDLITQWHSRTSELRMTGCGLLNFVHLAAGKTNVAVAQNLSPADMATAMLIAQESGALTGNATGAPVKMDSGELMAAAPRLFKHIVASNMA